MEPRWDDEADELAPLRRRSPLTAVVAVLLVLALVASGIVIAFDRTSSDDGGERTGPPIEIPDGPPPSESELDLVVAELSDFVSDARALEFKEPVPVTLLDDDEFSTRVEAEAVNDLDGLKDTERVLRAYGLLDDDVDLAAVLTSFLGDGVVGFYDPVGGELVVRGAALTPYVRLTLVHELTHALDDQHFELDRPALDDADDETGTGFLALQEGNAVRVQEEYLDTLSSEEQDQAAAEEGQLGQSMDLSNVPRVLPEIIGFPYAFGPTVVALLLQEGGESRVNEAFADPPTTSEQVLDPATWLAEQAEPIDVPPPAADGEVFDEGVLGLWGIVLLLEDELGQQDAFVAAHGWGGDWYVAWERGDEVCVRNTFVMDTPEDLKELASALDDWAVAQDDAEITRTEGQVSLLSCG